MSGLRNLSYEITNPNIFRLVGDIVAQDGNFTI